MTFTKRSSIWPAASSAGEDCIEGSFRCSKSEILLTGEPFGHPYIEVNDSNIWPTTWYRSHFEWPRHGKPRPDGGGELNASYTDGHAAVIRRHEDLVGLREVSGIDQQIAHCRMWLWQH